MNNGSGYQSAGGALGSVGDAAIANLVVIKHADGSETGYATPELAKAASVSGDTVNVYSSFTIVSSLAKNGVNWYFTPGVTITMNGGTAAGNLWIWDASSLMSFTIGGFGNFIRNTGAATGFTVSNRNGILRSTNASSNITFYFNQCQMNLDNDPTNGSGGSLTFAGILGTEGKLKIIGNEFLTANADTDPQATGFTSTVVALWWTNGDMNAIINDIVAAPPATAAGNVLLYHLNNATPTGDFRVLANRIDAGSPDENVISATDTSTGTSASWFRCATLQGSIFANSGKIYVDTQKFFGFCLISGTAAATITKLYLNTRKIGANLAATQHIFTVAHATSGYLIHATVDEFEPGTNWGNLVNMSGSGADAFFLTCQDMVAATGADAVVVTGGTLNLLSGKITPASGKVSLNQSGGTLNVTPAVEGYQTSQTGTITQIGVTAGVTLSTYGVGTAYTFTNSQAAIAFGTTSPSLALSKIGRWEVEAAVNIQDNSATVATSATVTTKLRNTTDSADLTNGSDAFAQGALTTISATGKTVMRAEITITAQPKTIAIFGAIANTPSVGTVTANAVGTYIRARYLGPS